MGNGLELTSRKWRLSRDANAHIRLAQAGEPMLRTCSWPPSWKPISPIVLAPFSAVYDGFPESRRDRKASHANGLRERPFWVCKKTEKTVENGGKRQV